MSASVLLVTVMQFPDFNHSDAVVHCVYHQFVFHFHVSFPLIIVQNLAHFPLFLLAIEPKKCKF